MWNRSIPVFIFLVLLSGLACRQNAEQDAAARSAEAVAEDSLRQMIGQMLLVGFRGMTIDSVSPRIKEQVAAGQVGSIVLFDYDVRTKEFYRNIRSPEQVRRLIADLQALSPFPLLVSIDQEGGRVNRLKPRYGFDHLASAGYLGALNDLDSTRHYARLNAENLAELGFNVNFAPAVDLNVYPESPAIGKIERSWGADPDRVVAHASVWIEEHAARGIYSTLKHFPGHGSAHADSHLGVTDVTPWWQAEELEPFRRLLGSAPLTGVMTAHVYHAKLDSIYPATLSERVIHRYIREEFGFDGLVFSDDLQMHAIHEQYDFPTILERAILAGADVLVFGNNLEYEEDIPQRAVDIIAELVAAGRIPQERIEASYRRIMTVKERVAGPLE